MYFIATSRIELPKLSQARTTMWDCAKSLTRAVWLSILALKRTAIKSTSGNFQGCSPSYGLRTLQALQIKRTIERAGWIIFLATP